MEVARLQTKAFGKQILDRHLQVALLAFEDDDGVLSEFENHLPAGATRRAWELVAVHHGYRANFWLDSCRVHGGKDGRALGADGEPVRSVFHIASGKDLSLIGKNRGSNVKIRIRGVGSLQRLPRGIQK